MAPDTPVPPFSLVLGLVGLSDFEHHNNEVQFTCAFFGYDGGVGVRDLCVTISGSRTKHNIRLSVQEDLLSRQPVWLEPLQRSPPGFALFIMSQAEEVRRIVVFFATFKRVVWVLPFVHVDGKKRSVSLDNLRSQLQPAVQYMDEWEAVGPVSKVEVRCLAVQVSQQQEEGMLSVDVISGSFFPAKVPAKSRGASSSAAEVEAEASEVESDYDMQDAEVGEVLEADGESLASSDETCLGGDDEVVGQGGDNLEQEPEDAADGEEAGSSAAEPEPGLGGGEDVVAAVRVGVAVGEARHARGTFVAWSNGFFTLSHGANYVTVRAHPRSGP